MDSKLTKEEEGSSQTKKKLDNWKFPKIPVNQVYKKKMFRIFSSYAVKDFEDTVTLKGNEQKVSINLLSDSFLKGFINKKHRYMHIGLVQIAIKPLQREGLEGPIVVCLRDSRQLDFCNSLLALVESDLYKGPFYFDCFPSFSVSLTDPSSLEVLILEVNTGGIPLALTHRLVCKVMPDLCSEALKKPVLGETTYFHPDIGTGGTTKWEEFVLPIRESLTSKQDTTTQHRNLLKNPDNSIFQQGRSMTTNEEERSSSKIKAKLEKWKYPKIPVNQVYKKKIYNNQRKAAKDFEQTITLRGDEQNVSVNLLRDLISKKEFEHVHLGLVQVAIKPLMNDGLKDAVIVCLRDERFKTFEKSLLAVVESNLSQGPFYFNCFPGYPISSHDCDAFTLSVVTNGVPLVLTYRVVCHLARCGNEDSRIIQGETTYFQPMAIIGTQRTTKWDEVQFPESWTQYKPYFRKRVG